MRKNKVVLFIIILILVLIPFEILINKESIVTSVRKAFFKATTVATGTTGTCNWTLDSDGLLLIEPINGVSGTMGNDSPFLFSNPTPSFYIYMDQVKSIKFNATVYAPANSESLFTLFDQLILFDGDNFDTRYVTNMRRMFEECDTLLEMNVSNFNTQNVTNMENMFDGCKALTELDLSSFNTQNVTSMKYMFNNCWALTELDVSSFNTQNVTDMECMFLYCTAITEIDISNFNTQNVTDMSNMFQSCTSLTELDVSNFNTQNVTNMSVMFSSCPKLTSLDLGSFNTQNVTTMKSMFYECRALTEINISSFNTSNVTDMRGMFNYCEKLTELNLSSFNTQNVTDMNYIMYYCKKLKVLTLGPDFSFIHKTNELPNYSTPWVKQGTTAPRYTSSELMNTYNGATMAGTYVRINMVTVSLKKDDGAWENSDVKVALYQNGTEVYSYSQGEVSQEDGTISWYDVVPGTYDVYASKDTNNPSVLVDTGKDAEVSIVE